MPILAFFAWLATLAATLAPGSGQAAATLVLTDHFGRRVEVRAHPQRIVSLAPSLTEALFALGVGDRVVGVTDFCDYPAEARTKARIGGMINPSLERIVTLQPDLVLITQEGNRRETLDALERLGVPTYAVKTTRLEDISRTLRDLGQALGEAGAGEALASELERRIALVREAVKGRPARRVLFLVWLQPLVSVGRSSFLGDLLEQAGAESIAQASSQPWPHLSIEEIVRREPDFIVVPRSSDFAPTREDLLRLPGWRKLGAVREGRILYVPAAIQRPGPRIAEMLETLARALHPEAFAAGRPEPSPAISAATSGSGKRRP